MSDFFAAKRTHRLRPVLALVLAVFLSGSLYAQVSSAGPKDPVNPSDLRPVFDFPRPWHPAAAQKGFAVAESIEVPPISYTPSISYQFSNERSRVGGISLDSNSAIIDFTVARNNPPFTSIDFSYMFSYASGSSPANESERIYQNVASFSVLQPLDRIWDATWEPAALRREDLNNQFSVLFGASYGHVLSSVLTPNLPSAHGFAHPFVGDALFDYQFAWFNLFPPKTNVSRYDRPNIFLECSSGIQLSTVRLGASRHPFSITSSETQLTYQNICNFTYSFFHRLGLLVAAEWDAPLDSAPVHGSRPDYANVVIFGGGLVYNLYPQRADQGKTWAWDWNRLSLTLLYSYTAFDPSTETNQVQLQISYSF